jgi:tRNA threonylcarbamoyladenosine biosynthesis protein TsaB
VKVLGIDTSGYANALGIVEDGSILAELNYAAMSDSIEKITLNIDEVLKKANLKLSDIEGIGVGLGPGSWTGIRIGVTVGKMLAFSLNKPTAGIPTLEALAYNAREKVRPVFAIIDVGAGNTVYAGKYQVEADNITRNGEYYVGDIEGLAVLVTEPVVFAGVKAGEYAWAVEKKAEINVTAIETSPSGASVAILAERRLSRGEGNDVLSIAPLYLKESTAKAFVNKYRVSHK